MTELFPGAVIAGKYRLERVVGRGGMGAVWAARNQQLDMLVAVKFIEAGEGVDLADARARFEREARTAAQIRSPHVAQIIDHGVDGDRPFIAMELLEGEDLSARLRRVGRLSLPAVAKILSQSAKALRRAHEAGIIHRDLKPGNIFLARFDEDEVVKILDFGVAKVRAGVLDGPMATQTGVVFGSPTYMSPEQARGVRALDHRSDLWSMAVIVFRAITGVKPFEAASIGDLVVKLCIDPLPVATTIARDLPPEVDAFFTRAFARDPAQRFSSAVEMAAAFEAIAGSAVSAPVPSLRFSQADLPPGAGPAVGLAPPPYFPPAGLASPFAPPSISGPLAVGGQPPAPPPALWAPPYAPLPAPPAAPPPAFAAAAPPPDAGAVPRAPASGSGSFGQSGAHVAFAPGTLTPPPGAAPERPQVPAEGPSSAQPPSSGWPPPSAPSAPTPVPLAPARPRARDPRWMAGGLALTAVALLGVIFLLVRRGGGPVSAAVATAVPASVGAAPTAAPPSGQPAVSAVASAVEAPVAAAAPEPSASASSSAEPAPPGSQAAPGPSADPSARSSASPRSPTKPGKRRPNFGY